MKRLGLVLIVIVAGILYGSKMLSSDKYSNVKARAAAVAGQFYPADSSKLAQALDSFLADAVPASVNKPIALIAPHAGYLYSGQIAADAYTQARNHDYDVIVLLGTNHTTAGFDGISLYPRQGYQTPLGLAAIDEQLVDALMKADKDCTFNPAVHSREHSIEVQVPFVQHLFPGVKILPAVIGQPDPDLCLRFGKALAEVLRDRNALIVASSDLSHYPAYDEAAATDKRTLEAITELDPTALHSALQEQVQTNVPNLVTCACGEAPILVALAAAQSLGANCRTIISYANSGDTSIGQRSRVVGYGAVALSADDNCEPAKVPATPPPEDHSGTLQDSHKKALLAFARKTIHQFLTTETLPLARGFDPILERKQGVFVTLRKHGQLRGCTGHMESDLPLCKMVGSMALYSAFNDRRFKPVTLEEMADMEIEISLLTPYRPIASAKEIVLGRDGVVLEKDGHTAVFLPQVATEMGWDRDELLDHLCRKAGLPPGCWQQEAKLFVFQAKVFDDSEFK